MFGVIRGQSLHCFPPLAMADQVPAEATSAVTSGGGGTAATQVDHLLLAGGSSALAPSPSASEDPVVAFDPAWEAGSSGSASGVEDMLERWRRNR